MTGKIRGPRLNKDIRVALAEATAAARANGTLIVHRINGVVHARQTVATIRDVRRRRTWKNID